VREQAGCYHRWRAIIDDDNNTDLYSTPKGADLITSQIKTDLSHCENLWDFMTYSPPLSSAQLPSSFLNHGLHPPHPPSHNAKAIFRKKAPKTYLSVETSLINEGSQIFVVCTDITKVRELEKKSQVIRSQFFSSIAHELRTPLNSVIPILLIVINYLTSNTSVSPVIRDYCLKYLKIVLNSGYHLQNVIEDALDLARL
jgi:signal transduction histidine kinase